MIEGLRLRRVRVFSLDPRATAGRPTRSPRTRSARARDRAALPYPSRRGRRRVLRAEARHHRARRHRPQWQLGTVQVDFVLPDASASIPRQRRRRSRPVMIHRALGRFAGALLRRADRALRAALSGLARADPGGRRADLRAPGSTTRNGRASACASAGFRIELDESNEKLGYKIRHWKTQKVPYILVVGKAEAEAEGTVSPTSVASTSGARRFPSTLSPPNCASASPSAASS